MEFKYTKETLITIGQLVKEQYQSDLKTNPKKYGNGRNSYASGKLYNSIDYKIVVDDGGIKLYFQAEDYYLFVENGSVFTTKMPPLSVIKKWMVSRNISGKNVEYKIQRSIFKKGIKPKPYLRDIKKTLNTDYKNEIELALKKDIKEYIKLIKQKLNKIK